VFHPGQLQTGPDLCQAIACNFVYLLLNVDIARAFDSISWHFNLEVMHFMGFSTLWCDWVSTILSTASTKVLLNGTLGERICHTCGLHQGDPLSPILFLLVMEVLSTLIRKSEVWMLQPPLEVCSIAHHASFYIDDLVLFISHHQQDLQMA
jgi:hypothetical protein